MQMRQDGSTKDARNNCAPNTSSLEEVSGFSCAGRSIAVRIGVTGAVVGVVGWPRTGVVATAGAVEIVDADGKLPVATAAAAAATADARGIPVGRTLSFCSGRLMMIEPPLGAAAEPPAASGAGLAAAAAGGVTDAGAPAGAAAEPAMTLDAGGEPAGAMVLRGGPGTPNLPLGVVAAVVAPTPAVALPARLTEAAHGGLDGAATDPRGDRAGPGGPATWRRGGALWGEIARCLIGEPGRCLVGDPSLVGGGFGGGTGTMVTPTMVS